MRTNWNLFVLAALGAAGVICSIASNFVQDDFELEIYLILMAQFWIICMVAALTIIYHDVDDRRIKEQGIYITRLMERVNDLEKAQK